ncbi:hypothetical protein GALMADRAFT_65460 [Galerina marginata CBS 339.88]|uniref:Importin-13 n=1 Tax=Galerina marginata (strain CBS 339.88) TaxID=685588 RepID=A0A067TGT3_GALM3|nr:hypothetical protein GALMADRAFT_65460 [Galerina marginata CBS 339.88]
MANPAFLPTLSQFDIEHAAQLIQRAYAPSTTTTTPEELKRFQQDLFEIQKRPEAWGLVIPLLNYQDQNVQFFGAHTAQVKIARDWEMFPVDHVEDLRDLMVQLSAHSVAIGRSKFILRKLFVALTSLALKLASGHPSRWPEWIISCISAFSAQGASTEHIHDFLAIVAEEVGNADLLGSSKMQMQQTMIDASPMVAQAITTTITQPLGTFSTNQYLSALRCLQAWMTFLKTDHLIPIIPLIINLLDPNFSNDSIFIAASDVLQEMSTKSPLSDGSGTKTFTEPLMVWMSTTGNGIMESMLASEDVLDLLPMSHSLCKLVVALGDHSTSYIATNIASSMPVPTGPTTPPTTKGHLTQNFLRLLLAYTGLPGYYGVDEEESEMTLGFWYLFQEALWSTDFYIEEGGDDRSPVPPDTSEAGEAKQVVVAKAVFSELVKVLRRKVAFPPPGSGWSRDQIDKFQVYRRDVGDTLINAYYVLRDDMLGYYVNDIAERLAVRQEADGWQEIEATLHCIMSIQEAIDMDTALHLNRLFSPEILGRLPSTGRARVRRTALGVIGSYSSWFATQQASAGSPEPNLLLTVLSYVVSALPDPSLSLSAATALRNLCEANRKDLAPHIAKFGELHAGLNSIPDSEKSKVLQSIASVIQAVPPADEIPAIEAIVNPIVQKLYEALQTASTLPDEARASTILHLETLSGVAKGLTRTVEGMTILEDESDPDFQADAENVKRVREDPRAAKLRDTIFTAIRGVVDLWSSDAAVGHALSDLFKSITSLPADITLISLPAGPLLELVCLAAQRQLTAAWLSLAHILIAQLNPPVFSLVIKSGPTPEAETIVRNLLPVLVQCGLTALGMDGAMESNPDIVQEFFSCMDQAAQDFTDNFYTLPPGLFDALIQCAITALSLQERYSLVSACNFLATIIHRSSLTDELIPHKTALMTTHGRSLMRAILQGFAGVAPRSVVPNLIEMLGTLLSRASGADGGPGGGAPQWIKDVLMSDDFVPSKAGPEAKAKFIKAVAGSRSLKKTREAAQQFTLVARGLEGSNFGYSTLTM